MVTAQNDGVIKNRKSARAFLIPRNTVELEQKALNHIQSALKIHSFNNENGSEKIRI